VPAHRDQQAQPRIVPQVVVHLQAALRNLSDIACDVVAHQRAVLDLQEKSREYGFRNLSRPGAQGIEYRAHIYDEVRRRHALDAAELYVDAAVARRRVCDLQAALLSETVTERN